MSAPIGTWKCNSPAFLGNCDRPTNEPTGGHYCPKGSYTVTSSKKNKATHTFNKINCTLYNVYRVTNLSFIFIFWARIKQTKETSSFLKGNLYENEKFGTIY